MFNIKQNISDNEKVILIKEITARLFYCPTVLIFCEDFSSYHMGKVIGVTHDFINSGYNDIEVMIDNDINNTRHVIVDFCRLVLTDFNDLSDIHKSTYSALCAKQSVNVVELLDKLHEFEVDYNGLISQGLAISHNELNDKD